MACSVFYAAHELFALAIFSHLSSYFFLNADSHVPVKREDILIKRSKTLWSGKWYGEYTSSVEATQGCMVYDLGYQA